MFRTFALLLFFLPLSIWAQQPWTRGWGEAYVQSGVTYFGYQNVYGTPKSSSQPNRKITQVIASEYIELGLSKRLMFTANVPFQHIESGKVLSESDVYSGSGSLNGFGNIYTGLTANLLKKNGFVLSIAGGVYQKSASRDDSKGIQTGVQCFGFEPLILGGWGSAKKFVAFGAGMNFRTESYTNQLVVKAKWGSRIGKQKKGWFIVGSGVMLPVHANADKTNLEIDGTSYYNYVYVNEQGFASVELTMGYEINKNWSTWFNLGGGPGWKIGKAGVFSLSIARKFTKVEKQAD